MPAMLILFKDSRIPPVRHDDLGEAIDLPEMASTYLREGVTVGAEGVSIVYAPAEISRILYSEALDKIPLPSPEYETRERYDPNNKGKKIETIRRVTTTTR